MRARAFHECPTQALQADLYVVGFRHAIVTLPAAPINIAVYPPRPQARVLPEINGTFISFEQVLCLPADSLRLF